MNDFLNSIKITDKDKKEAITKILYTIINYHEIISLDEFLKKESLKVAEGDKPIEEKLNENEILAAYTLANKIKISIMSATNKELIEYLELSLASVNEENLLKFINEMVKDIETTKKRTPDAKWNLEVGKIFKRLKGEKPYSEEEITTQKIEKSGTIIELD